MDFPVYTLRRATRNAATDWWQARCFATAEEGRISHFQKESGPLHPKVVFRGVYDDAAIMLRYEVESVGGSAELRAFNGKVYLDSCCEFFAQPPRPSGGYMNFEVNAGGILHTSHILDPTRIPGGFKNFRYVRPEHGGEVEIYRWQGGGAATKPCGAVAAGDSTAWGTAVRIPFALLRSYVGPWREGEPWRANFYSCQEVAGVRYFASWAPIPFFNFHSPQYFGVVKFEP